VDFFENQNHFTVPEPWLHSAIPNTHLTNIVQYDTDSALIGINTLSSYACTNSMQDFLPGTYSPDRTESIMGLGGTKQDTTGIGTIRWLIQDDDRALHEFILPNVWFIPSNPICILSPQRLAEDLQDKYHKGTGEMTTAGEMVLLWDGRWYKQTIHHHPHSKCPLLPTEPGINAAHQIMHVWNDCLPRESMRVNTRSRPSTLLQMLAPKPPANPIAFLSSMDLQLDNTSAAMADSKDTSITSTMTYNEGHEDELSALLMPNLLKRQCRVILPSKETHPKMRELSSQVKKDVLAKLDVIKIQAEQASAPLTEALRALMSLHECLGHADMATLQQWAKGNKFPNEPASIKNCPLPRCSGCLFAKAQRKSWHSRTEPAGIRATSPTPPGSTVHVDQLEVTMRGLITTQRQAPTFQVHVCHAIH
jgi:hypothetical protein